jgi:hypothetical protein
VDEVGSALSAVRVLARYEQPENRRHAENEPDQIAEHLFLSFGASVFPPVRKSKERRRAPLGLAGGTPSAAERGGTAGRDGGEGLRRLRAGIEHLRVISVRWPEFTRAVLGP